MRGDRPLDTVPGTTRIQFTPHARGSTLASDCPKGGPPVYPACAGIDHNDREGILGIFCLPRMRGDRPLNVKDSDSRQEFTPHARGSTWRKTSSMSGSRVYPACAGIDLYSDDHNRLRLSLPRMRGDRPPSYLTLWLRWRFTPHARGSTSGRDALVGSA